ncbi:protein fem-1 homolog CG6966-like [Macrobrachium nipponense]|uniref:protein fem-1 homolog CG6966-like n=1 Tax=Macrobrachium nipponense TaxID=159736 RepID=UPI0030C83A24
MDGKMGSFECVANSLSSATESCCKMVKDWIEDSLLSGGSVFLGHLDCARVLVEQEMRMWKNSAQAVLLNTVSILIYWENFKYSFKSPGFALVCVRFTGDSCTELGLCGALPSGTSTLVIDTYLLSKGANVNGITRFKSTPLRAACIHGHLDIAKLLVAHGASTETTDPYSFTCLMLAAHNRRLEIVPAHEEFREVTTLEQLEAIETDFESVHVSPLLVKARVLGPDHLPHCYISGTQVSTTQMTVLSSNASTVGSRYRSAIFRLKPLNHARLYHFRSFVGLFSSLTDAEHPQLSSSQIHTFRSALYQLLKKDPRDAAGWSLLHIACCRSFKLMDGFSVPVSSTPRKTVIDLLLDTGADPCATDKEGNTPLHTLLPKMRMLQGMVESLLLRAGGHLDAMNSRRQTFWSLRGCSLGTRSF